MTFQPDLRAIETAAEIVYSAMPPTPQYTWPLLCEKLGTEVWVKHENHTPIGAFKIRGGLVYFSRLAGSPECSVGVITATRGNHGQSIGLAARRYNIPATIVVPQGNSVEKNAAMAALGVELVEYGDDFQAAAEYARELAEELSLLMVPSFHPHLVAGVATYSLEFLRAASDMDIVYVPVGMGSGICGMVAAREALGLGTAIIGVVSSHATAYAESFESRCSVESPVTTKLADGLAVRKPDQNALDIIWRNVERFVRVSDNEIAAAMRTMFECTHNVCEGAGAAGLAAAMQEKNRLVGRKVGLVLSGANVDRALFKRVLNEEAPSTF